MRQSPETNSEEFISYKIYNEGSPIDDSLRVTSVQVQQEINRIGRAQIIIELPQENEVEGFTIGNIIRIEAGYNNSEKSIFEGSITSHKLEINATACRFIIDCCDFAYPMIHSKKNRVFENKKDSEIIQEILGEYNDINSLVTETSIKYNQLVQYNYSDWDFMLLRANLNGMVAITEARNIRIIPPDLSASPILKVTYREDMIAFKGNVKAYGPMGELAINGEVKFLGNSHVNIGNIIELAGLAKHFNGNIFVSTVQHEIQERNWITTVGFGLPQVTTPCDSEMITSAGLSSDIQGMHIGKVVQLEDPNKENRIQIELPLLKEGENKIWAQLATFWAGNQYGAFFIPTIGDEVVVSFFNNDLNQVVILGSLHSNTQPPAMGIQQNNNPSIITKSRLMLQFEEEKKKITLTTPGNNTIEISDEGKGIKLTDQNNNKIEMNNNGIFLESSTNISLKATVGITIEAGTTVDVKAQSSLHLKAVNIEANADAGFTAKGGAQAELSASGQTVVKGAIVMIN